MTTSSTERPPSDLDGPALSPPPEDRNVPRLVSVGRRPQVWLAIGFLLQLFAVGGRWDLPLTAWVFHIFLLRFARTSRPVPGLLLVWMVCAAGSMFWALQLAVPITPVTAIGVLSLSSAGVLPYLADRLLHLRLGPVGRLLIFPAALTAVSFLLGSYNPFGTAYGLLAVTQHADLALLQVIALAGPYVIAFLIGTVATAVNHLWEEGLAWRGAKPVVTVATIVAVVIVGGQARMAFTPAASSPTVRVAGINPSQASLDAAAQLLDRDPTGIQHASEDVAARLPAASGTIIDQLFADTREAADAGAKIVFWSEDAVPMLDTDKEAFLADAATLAREEGIYLNVAMNLYTPYGQGETALLGPDGDVLWSYRKHHPIPGLEPDTAGVGPVPVVDTPYGRLSNVICYDADFPAMMRVPADIMLVPGRDWPEIGYIHTKMASLRAIENGYALVRQDFNGSSQAFDHQGRVLSQQDTTSGENRPWIVDVPTRGVTTPYRVIGDVFAWLCAGAVLVAIGTTIRRSRGARSPGSQA